MGPTSETFLQKYAGELGEVAEINILVRIVPHAGKQL